MSVLEGTSAGDLLTGTALDDVINGRDGDDRIEAMAGNDVVDGGEGDDTIDGGDGDDLLLASAGSDLLIGGAGFDTVSFATSTRGVTVNFVSGSAGDHRVSGIESAIGSSFGDQLVASADGSRLNGGDGDDTFWGNSGNDILLGGSGDDRFSLTASGMDVVDGGAGRDEIDFRFSDTGATLNLLLGILGDETGGTVSGIEVVFGSAHVDRLIGDANANVITGLAGADYIDGGAGNDEIDSDEWASTDIAADQIFGGDGNDRITINVNDSADGGAGFDLLDLRFHSLLQGVSVDLTELWTGGEGTVGTGTVKSFEALGEIRGSNFDDTIFVGSSGNTQWNARVLANGGNDLVIGGTDDDDFHGGDGNDTLIGLDGSDDLSGGEGDDRLEGGAGDDRLSGDGGADILIGGSGSDVYDYFGNDQIIEFAEDVGTDVIRMSAMGLLADQALAGIRNVEELVLIVSGERDPEFDFILGENASLAGFQSITYNGSVDASAMTVGVEFRHALYSSVSVKAGSGDDLFTFMQTFGPWHQTWSFDGGQGVDTIHVRSADFSSRLNADSQTGRVLLMGVEKVVLLAGADAIAVADAEDQPGKVEQHDLKVHDGMIAAGQRLTIDGSALRANVTTSLGFDREIGGGDDYMRSETLRIDASTLTEGRSIEVIGGAANDILTGSSAADVISGGEGDDTLRGGGGADRLAGGAGNDVFIGTASELTGDTIIDFTNGNRIVISDANLQTFSYAFDLNSRLLTFTGGSLSFAQLPVGRLVTKAADGGGVEISFDAGAEGFISGSDGDDLILGSADRDVILGLAGDDVIYGLEGNDELNGGTGADLLDGGDGDDFLIAGDSGSEAESDILNGGAGNDRITAGFGDSVDGGAGSDSLNVSLYVGATAGIEVDFRQLTNGGSVTIGGATLSGIEYVTYLSLTRFDDIVIAGAVAGVEGIILDGWDGNDDLTGSSGVDYIYGGDGDDIIRGGIGFNPAIVPSTDRLRGEAGNDTIYIGRDGAEASGGAGFDTIYGGDGVDSISGDADDDTLYGGAGDDGLSGGDGDDFIDGGTGADTMSGGSGRDTYVIDNALDVIFDSDRENTVFSSITYIMPTAIKNLTLTGSANINGTGNSADNVIIGNAGANTLNGGGGTDTLKGGAGDDIYFLDVTGDQVIEYAGEGVDTVRSSATFVLGANIENLTLTGSAAINGGGNELANLIRGNNAANLLSGGDGNDTLEAGEGDDILNGGNGDDILDGSFGRDAASYAGAAAAVSVSLALVGPQATGGGGTDTLIGIEDLTGSGYDDVLTGNAFSNVIEGLAGDDILDGGDGVDTVSYSQATAGVTVTLGLTDVQDTKGAGRDRLTGFEILQGSSHGDTLIVASERGEIYGLDGDDRIISTGRGSAALYGGNGNDLFVPGPGDDWIHGGDGFDTVDYSASTGPVSAATNTANNNVGSGYDSLGDVEKIIGSRFNDTLTAFLDGHQVWGGAGDDLLSGAFGTSQLHGGTGNDTYKVSSASNLVVELAGEGVDLVLSWGNYVLPDNVENLTLLGDQVVTDPYAGASVPSGPAGSPANGTGNGLNNILTGNAYANQLSGLGGADILTGRGGRDTLTGGAGSDLFRDTAAGLNGDTIMDFSGRDRIVITDANFATFNFNLSGSTLYYSGGSLTFGAALSGALVATAGASGGVVLTLSTAGGQFGNSSGILVTNFTVGAGGWSSQDQFPRHIADMNGDGFSDIVGFGQAGVMVALGSASGSFSAPSLLVPNFGEASGWTSDNQYHRELADLNGDGRADIVGFGVAGTIVSFSKADGAFTGPIIAAANFGTDQGWTTQDGYARVTGDVNGDGKADLIGFGVAGTLVALGNGDGTFVTAALALANFGTQQGWTSDNAFHREVADVNGDGFDDLVGFGTAGTWVALSTGDGAFEAPRLALGNFGKDQGWSSQNSFARDVADVNGDGYADIVGFGIAGTYVAYGKANGTFSAPSLDVLNFGTNQGWTSDNSFHRELADINNDGLVDIVGFGQAGVLAGYNDGYWLP